MTRRYAHLLILIPALSVAGCSDDSGVGGDAGQTQDVLVDPCAPPYTVSVPAIPPNIAASTQSTIRSFRSWHLIENDLTAGQSTLTFEVIAPSGAQCLDLWIGGQHVERRAASPAQATLELEIGGYGPGAYELLLVASGEAHAFAQLTFYRTHPYYVLVTNDWDDALQEPDFRTREEALHANHPAMKMTHFVGPYTFTDPTLTQAEIDASTAWLLDMRDTYDDEIGLHVHPYCNFVETTSVTCRWTPSLAYQEDPEGYSVVLGAYTQAETELLFEQAKSLFQANGLGTPTSFRAGGWAAELHTLAALANTGFVADTSGCNWSRMEEWQGIPNASLYEWNEAHWSTIDEWSQPYYPNEGDILSGDPPHVPILEIPDNGNLIDYVTDAELIEMFEANWPGGALLQPTTYVTGYHPTSFENYNGYLNDGLTHIDGFLAEHGQGPVVYETITNMTLVWPLPE